MAKDIKLLKQNNSLLEERVSYLEEKNADKDE